MSERNVAYAIAEMSSSNHSERGPGLRVLETAIRKGLVEPTPCAFEEMDRRAEEAKQEEVA